MFNRIILILSLVILVMISLVVFNRSRHQMSLPVNENNISPILPEEPLKDSTTEVVTCLDDEQPRIISLSKHELSIGDSLIVNGCNFAGFGGNLYVWISPKDQESERGFWRAESGSNSNKLNLILKDSLCHVDTSYSCEACPGYLQVKPGVYKLFTDPLGKKSNVVEIVIK